VGDKGKVVTIDIEPKMIERVMRRAQAEDAENVEASLADGHFDAIYMIAVIGEIPSPEGALKEFYRLLGPWGSLAFSEFLNDPDYPRAGTLIR
jgi:ubiquinone/menaquinone biosynthesis C-methylase UbiE